MRNASFALAAAMLLACCALVGCASSDMQSDSSSSTGPSSASSASLASSPVSSGASAVLLESEWGDYFPTLGDDAVAFGQRVQSELPVKAYALYQGEGGGEPIEFDDPADIAALFNALASTNVGEPATEVSTDDYTSFWFEFADGSSFGFMFDSMTIEMEKDGTWEFYAIEPNPALESFASLAKQHTMEMHEG